MNNIADMLRKTAVKADVFFSGRLCGIQSFEGNDKGHLHLLRSGRLTLLLREKQKIVIDEPSVIFIPGPVEHRILANQSEDAQLVCATVSLESHNRSLLLDALPELLCLPLSIEKHIGQTASWLFEEAFSESVTRSVMIDKLSEMFLLQVMRYVLDNNLSQGGMLAALSHPAIAKAMSAMHRNPAHNWSVESLAGEAAMSRSKFAATFREVVGTTPNEYLTEIRINQAQELLLSQKPVNLVANEVGYEHGSALARIFRKKLGLSPKAWLKLRGNA